MANKETEGGVIILVLWGHYHILSLEDVADYPIDIAAFRMKLKDESFDPPPPSTGRRSSRSILDFFDEGVDIADSGPFIHDVGVVNSPPMKFNNKGLKERSGTHSDRDNLKETVANLGFQVETFDDLTKKQIQQVINAYANKDHSNHDCIACAILTHGEYENILHAKDRTYNISTVLEPFRKCRSLVGKPKLFFIQACRGIGKDQGIIGLDQVDGDPIQSDYIQTIPVEADFLIGYSTVSGYLAWRNEEKGSWYIQALCRCLKEFSNKLDLLSIMTRVNRMVAHDCEASNQEKQMPSCVSRLTSEVYLNFKADCIPDGKIPAKASTIMSQIDSSQMYEMPNKTGIPCAPQSELKKEVCNIKLELNNLKRKELDLKAKLRDVKEKIYEQELKSLQE